MQPGGRVGTFRYSLEVGRSPEGPFVVVEALVDTGATYSLFPRSLLESLGVTADDRAEFLLADGRTITRDLATVRVRIGGRTRLSLCVMGEEDAQPLLGAVTLELFGLAADPINRRLIPAPLYLLPIAAPARA